MAGPQSQHDSSNNIDTSASATSNRLNLFKFGSRKSKSSNSIPKSQSSKDENSSINNDNNDNKNDTNKNNDELDPMESNHGDDEAGAYGADDDDDNIHSYRPDSYISDGTNQSQNQQGYFGQAPQYHSARSPSESSLIFERSVEDPAQVYQQTTCPRCGKNATDGNKLNCNHQSIVNLPSHYSVENFVSPCLDATTKILTDQNTDLDNVDMVYSRRPSSVMGLNMALGRTKSFAANSGPGEETPFSPISKNNSSANLMTKANSSANFKELDPNAKRPPTLSFYSYADMINNENANPKRPSISQSLSSSFINTRSPNSRSNSISQSSSNFFAHAGNSITPQRHGKSGFSSNRASFSNHGPNSTIPQSLTKKNKFQLTPDSPNSSDSEFDTDFPNSIKSSSNNPLYHTTSSASARRKPSSASSSKRNPLNKTYSNQSSINSASGTVPGSPYSNRRYSNMDESIYGSGGNGSDNESLVISSIGDHLRRNNGEIKSSNNSIIA